MELTERKMKNLPWQATGVWLIYKSGVDPRTIMSLPTYYSYKRMLKTHGLIIDPKTLKK